MNAARTRQLLATWPVLIGMGLLMLGAGLQGTLIGLRATIDGFEPLVIGVVMSSYYVGYVAGSICTPQLMQRVGHIRVFAALTAIASAAILLQAELITPVFWSAMRMVSGFCFAGIYIVAESWLNDRATNENRGTLLALYMLVLYVGLGGGQFLLTLADPAGPMLFLLISALISIAVVPMSLSVQRAPDFDIPKKIRFRDLYRVSPLGVVGVIVSGVVASSVFSMGPVYGGLTGMGVTDIAAFMGASIVAAVVTQLPIGRWSDRTDRRTVLVVVCFMATLVAIAAAMFGGLSRPILFALAAAFGGIALTLYSLSLSHINDHLTAPEVVSASAAVILLNGLGSILGPLLVASMMRAMGPSGYFFGLAGMTASLVLFGLWRKARRASVPREMKVPFVQAQPQAVSAQMLGDIAQEAAAARTEVR